MGRPLSPAAAPSTTPGPDATTVVAAAACADYVAAVVQAALVEALVPLGGMGSIVRPGATVLIKPNLLSPRPPEQAVTTHPLVVAAVVRACLEAGAARVWVGDSPAGDHDDDKLWARTGVGPAVAAAGGEMRSFRGAVTPLPCGARHIPAPAWLDQVDVLISVPKLKTHMLTLLTCAMKNVYGMVPGETKSLFHGDYPSPRRMASFLVDVYAVFRPALTIVDAVVGLEGDGPANGTPVPVGVLLAGRDAVAVDACCAGALGLPPAAVPMLAMAAERGLGIADLGRIGLEGTGVAAFRRARLRLPRGRFLQRLPEWLFRAATWVATYRPEVEDGRCVRCGVCADVCSRGAIAPDADGVFRIDSTRCILCMCCLESCPRQAIAVRSPLLAVVRSLRRLKQRWRRRDASR